MLTFFDITHRFLFRSLFAASRLDVDIAEDFDLACEAHIGVFLEIIAQPEFLHERESVGIA